MVERVAATLMNERMSIAPVFDGFRNCSEFCSSLMLENALRSTIAMSARSWPTGR